MQNVSSDTKGENKMSFTVEFVENTTAKGFFVVLKNNSGPLDIFIAVPRRDFSAVSKKIPASTYTLSFYDLEENGLPNAYAAYKNDDSITVSGKGEGDFLELHTFCNHHMICVVYSQTLQYQCQHHMF